MYDRHRACYFKKAGWSGAGYNCIAETEIFVIKQTHAPFKTSY